MRNRRRNYSLIFEAAHRNKRRQQLICIASFSVLVFSVAVFFKAPFNNVFTDFFRNASEVDGKLAL
jgi:hypothetical protein